jgi:hypothetical protein
LSGDAVDRYVAVWTVAVTDITPIVHEGRIVGFAATRDNELFHFGTAVETWGTGLAVERLAASAWPTPGCVSSGR